MGWKDFFVWYKKPSFVPGNTPPDIEKANGNNGNATNVSSRFIPPKLSLERVLNGRTCTPMALYDFYMFLKFIEHSPENLEFLFWFMDYEHRFSQEINPPMSRNSESSSSVAPSSVTEIKDAPEMKTLPSGIPRFTTDLKPLPLVERDDYFRSIVQAAYSPTIIDSHECINCGPCDVAPPKKVKKLKKPNTSCNSLTPLTELQKTISNTTTVATIATIEENYRNEVDTIITIFLAPDAPKELNLPHRIRKATLDAAETRLDPEIFRPIACHAYDTLKNCSHRNFVRLGVSNGTFATICMATSMGILMTLLGFMTASILAFRHPPMHRRFALAAWPLWMVGISLILAGTRGSCFFLLLFSRRQPLPWERLEMESRRSSIASVPVAFMKKLSLFDRKLKVQDNALRAFQHKILLQSLLAGCLFATVMEAIWLSLPVWKH